MTTPQRTRGTRIRRYGPDSASEAWTTCCRCGSMSSIWTTPNSKSLSKKGRQSSPQTPGCAEARAIDALKKPATRKRKEPMSIHRAVAASLAFFLLPGFATAQNEWLTWGHDPERTGSNPDEKILNRDNVSRLEVKWTAQISTAPKEYVLSTMTAPVVATVNTPQGPVARVFVVGSDNTLFAIDADTGKI